MRPLTAVIVFGCLLGLVAPALSQSPKSIPVYPGATLTVEKEEGVEPVCCTFVTKDPLDKVLAFYETKLKSKPLDLKSFVAKYPEMKSQVEEVVKQLPSTVKIRTFVLEEMGAGEQKGLVLFELLSSPEGVKFSIPQESMTDQDLHFASEFRKLAGLQTIEERTAEILVDWERLSDCLPTVTLPGFVRGEVSGQTERSIAPPTSTATVIYGKAGRDAEAEAKERSREIAVTINDEGEDEELIAEMLKVSGESERRVKVKGNYDGKEGTWRDESGFTRFDRVFLVAKRFVVEIHSQGVDDMALVNKLMDSMDLEKLAKLK